MKTAHSREAKYKGPYHICVCFYGVLHNTGLVRDGASVPAAVQLDQGTAAVVARESAVCKRKGFLNFRDTLQDT